ncbi:hypothetical protein CAR_c01370 [Carnobacterium sp. 17-4]|uniref:hypothetical protein n=1 Tax=Carnobacterium sp. (strain 17-4) TaxID=208596 RepID=UPI00020589CA|nr:hypothetical protein [Carnobacterium sp. 17-4]AEB28888.1 hypothetical protein CAR_c01370 [Carnobacterium sp. 17-4]
MKKYDEYQKFMRYKYGYYSFNSLIALIVFNYLIGLFFNFHWATTKELEIIIIIIMIALFFINACVYKNAYFYKHDDKKSYSWLFFIIGVISLYTNFQTFLISPEKIILNGKVGSGVIPLFSGLIFLSISVTYFIRNRIDKNRKQKAINKIQAKN